MKPLINPLALFLILCALQLAVPVYMIGSREHVLKNGKVYKFRTAPVDPYDPFRGKYVSLRMDSSSAPLSGTNAPSRGQTVYAVLSVDTNGFTSFSSASVKKPESGEFIAAKAGWNSNPVSLELPFDRYYAEEKMAPEMERAYWSNSTRTNQNSYVTVRVLNGKAVLEELYISDMPIKDYVRKGLNK